MYRTVLCFIALCILLASGCASVQRAPEDVVAKRAQERLDALIKNERKKAYSYAAPGYRASVPFEVHHPKVAGANSWTDAKVQSVNCEEDTCVVTTLISYKMLRHKLENTRPMKEKWIKVDGQWWIYHR